MKQNRERDKEMKPRFCVCILCLFRQAPTYKDALLNSRVGASMHQCSRNCVSVAGQCN